MHRFFLLGAMALACILLALRSAMAADSVQQFTIDFGPLFTLVIWPALSIIAVAIASVIAFQLKSRFGLEVDKKTIETALQSGLQYAQSKASQANISSVVVQNKIVADAANYVISHVPDTLKSVGVDVSTPEGRANLQEKLEARLAPAVMVGDSSQTEMSVATAATIANPAIPSQPAPVDNPAPAP